MKMTGIWSVPPDITFGSASLGNVVSAPMADSTEALNSSESVPYS